MKNQFNLSISIFLLILLFSVLIISCNQKKCYDGKHIVISSDCCSLVDTSKLDKAVTGDARESVGSISGEVDCADIAIDTVKTFVNLENGIFTFSSVIFNNGDDDGQSTAGIILLPPNATVKNISILFNKLNHTPKQIEAQHCRGKITFCTNYNLAKKIPNEIYTEWISVEVVLLRSTLTPAMDNCTFGIFAYSQLPDLDMENNYRTTNNLKECLNN